MVQSWLDNTGLYQKYGIDQTTPKIAGEPVTVGELREIDLVIVLSATAYPFGATNYIIDDTTVLGAGMRIQEVETFVETAGAGATATLDIGLMRTDRTTVTSATGILAGKTVASMTAGEKQVLTVGSTFAGALIGTTTANVNHFTVRVNTANFTAGVIRVKVRYYKP